MMRSWPNRYLTATMCALIIGTLLWLGVALVQRGGTAEKQFTAHPSVSDLRGSLP